VTDTVDASEVYFNFSFEELRGEFDYKDEDDTSLLAVPRDGAARW